VGEEDEEEQQQGGIVVEDLPETDARPQRLDTCGPENRASKRLDGRLAGKARLNGGRQDCPEAGF
jgi:hypothetical protein